MTRSLVEPGGVMVGVLGPIEITGGASAIKRAKSTELVVYLATHRQVWVTADVLMEVLWGPGKPANSPTLAVVISAARTCLGEDRDGALYLPRIFGGDRLYYRVSDRVRLDYEVFTAEVHRAAAQEGSKAIRSLCRALSLVRGRPFDAVGRGYQWAHVDLAVRMAGDVADAAHRMAALCLADGDPEGARWAAQQGLLASEGNEALFRDWMAAEHLSGNPEGARAVMDKFTAFYDEGPSGDGGAW